MYLVITLRIIISINVRFYTLSCVQHDTYTLLFYPRRWGVEDGSFRTMIAATKNWLGGWVIYG